MWRARGVETRLNEAGGAIAAGRLLAAAGPLSEREARQPASRGVCVGKPESARRRPTRPLRQPVCGTRPASVVTGAAGWRRSGMWAPPSGAWCCYCIDGRGGYPQALVPPAASTESV